MTGSTDPTVADTDGGGFDDGQEVSAGRDPTDPNEFPGQQTPDPTPEPTPEPEPEEPSQNDRFEPNDARTSAPQIDPGRYESLTVVGGETDWFAVEVANDTEMTARVRFDHEAGNADLSVHGPNGDELGASRSTDDDERVTITADVSGMYYVRVVGVNDADVSYDLDIETTDVEDGTDAPPGDLTDSGEPATDPDDDGVY